MSWPEPGTAQKIRLAEIPVGASLGGLAPFGVRWGGTMTRKGPKPNLQGWPRGGSYDEFVVCFATFDGQTWEVIDAPA